MFILRVPAGHALVKRMGSAKNVRIRKTKEVHSGTKLHSCASYLDIRYSQEMKK